MDNYSLFSVQQKAIKVRLSLTTKKDESKYYTPYDAVQLIAAVIEPFEGALYENIMEKVVEEEVNNG